jgi:hypothetical protein
VPAPVKEKLATLEKEMAEIMSQMGGGGGGRGGRGGGGGAGGGRGGAGGPGGGEDNDQNAPPPVPASQTLQSRLASVTELLNVSFNPSPEQAKTLRTLPLDVEKQADRVKKLSAEGLPSLLDALRSAGVELTPATVPTTPARPPSMR